MELLTNLDGSEYEQRRRLMQDLRNIEARIASRQNCLDCLEQQQKLMGEWFKKSRLVASARMDITQLKARCAHIKRRLYADESFA